MGIPCPVLGHVEQLAAGSWSVNIKIWAPFACGISLQAKVSTHAGLLLVPLVVVVFRHMRYGSLADYFFCTLVWGYFR